MNYDGDIKQELYCILYVLVVNAHTYCMLYVLAPKKKVLSSIVQHLILAISVVYREWVNLEIVSAWHLVQ